MDHAHTIKHLPQTLDLIPKDQLHPIQVKHMHPVAVLKILYGEPPIGINLK